MTAPIEEDLRLLKAVAKHPIIYDYRMADYKCNDAKTNAWQEIVSALKTTQSLVKIKKRWKSIRDSYVKFRNRSKEVIPSSAVKPYKYNDHLQFLEPFILPPTVETTYVSAPSEDEVEDQTCTIVEVEDANTTDEPAPAPASPKKRKLSDTEIAFGPFRLDPSADDVDYFFYGLAQTVKKLRPMSVAKLKKEVANLVTDAEIRELEEVDNYYQ